MEPPPPSHTAVASSNTAYDVEVPWDKVNKFKFVSVGFGLGVAESLLFYPLDTLKTNLQADGGHKLVLSPLQAARSLMQSSGGLKALYRGFWVSNIGTAPSTILYLSVYNELKKKGTAWLSEEEKKDDLAVVVPLVSGACADLCSLVVYTPVDVMITHMQRGHNMATYKGNVVQVAKGIYINEGWKGFFRGFTASALTYTPTSALWWPSYEVSKRLMAKFFFGDTRDLESGGGLAGVIVASGIVAGVVAYALTNPMDLVRTRLVLRQQCYGHTNPLRVMAAVARHEGLRALSKGVVPRVLSAAPASALGSFTYEFALRVSLRQD